MSVYAEKIMLGIHSNGLAMFLLCIKARIVGGCFLSNCCTYCSQSTDILSLGAAEMFFLLMTASISELSKHKQYKGMMIRK